MHIRIITDSYGSPRPHKGSFEVPATATYPEILKKSLEKEGHQVFCDYRSFRKTTELPKIVQEASKADLYIFQTGVVDVYPRPLNQWMTSSASTFAKALRRLIRSKRAFIIRYIYRKPWSTHSELEKAIQEVCTLTMGSTSLWVNVAPVNAYQEAITPGANASIVAYNELLYSTTQAFQHAAIVNVYDSMVKSDNFEQYLHPEDAHLNIAGNRLYVDLIQQQLSQLFTT